MRHSKLWKRLMEVLGVLVLACLAAVAGTSSGTLFSGLNVAPSVGA